MPKKKKSVLPVRTTEFIREKVLDNIDSDRRKTEELIASLTGKIIQGEEKHSMVASDLSKYLEVLLKGNAQLVKIIEIETRKKLGTADEDPVKGFSADKFYDELEQELN